MANPQWVQTPSAALFGKSIKEFKEPTCQIAAADSRIVSPRNSFRRRPFRSVRSNNARGLMRRHLFVLVDQGGFLPACCFAGAGSFLLPLPKAAQNDVGDQTHHRRNDQRDQELTHNTYAPGAQHRPVLSPALRVGKRQVSRGGWRVQCACSSSVAATRSGRGG